MLPTAHPAAAGSNFPQLPGLLSRPSFGWTRLAVLALGVLVAPRDVGADTLVFENGDRLEGEVVSRAAGVIEFQSVRFGRISVKGEEAHVERHAVTAPGAPTEVASVSAPRLMEVTAKERSGDPGLQPERAGWLDPWQGRVSVTFDLRSDDSDNESVATDAEARRTWTTDEIEVEGHFSYAEDDGLKSTDVWKGAVKWRHDFSGSIFTNLRSAVEWNRGYMRNGVNDPYVLMQQEAGCGRTIVDTPQRALRAGLAGNLFSAQGRSSEPDTLQTVASIFMELELELPWQSRLTERGVLYRSLRGGDTGLENVIELNRKLTTALSVGLRHEYREDLPEVQVEDFHRFRVQLGLDF